MNLGGVGEQTLEEGLRLLGPLARRNVNLGRLTTYRVGGSSALFIEAQTEEDLKSVAQARNQTGLPVLVIGKGSNMLVADDGFPGIAVVLGNHFDVSTIHQETATVDAGSGVALPSLARRCVSLNLSGFEWAVGIPGSIGGAVRMNAGGHGGDMQASILQVNLFDLNRSTVEIKTKEEMAFGYRQSSITEEHIVLGATLQLDHDKTGQGGEILSEIVSWRRENQPGGQNAGSVFVNPAGETSGELLDRLGLKGFRIGSAQVSSKHANFVQADVGGLAADVDAVIKAVAQRVHSETGIELRTEIQRVGFEV
ncbi:MAG: UDP-N-acetylenolpyruvoylglucosamine reductase [Acidimicrobiaceae bacterium]|nr:UDP-N-acetylenolpyruvoylglucosamine reductase [Acidimicrobiaceae bacterium]|tara:strand:+ start:1623 stop:2552 length:930 start_codon:yes stop_codon:yes gene_type:complete